MDTFFKNSFGILIAVILMIKPASAGTYDLCELESNEYGTLISSVQSLEQELRMIPKECLESATKNGIEHMETLKSSTSRLSEMWQSQAAIAEDPNAFGMTLKTALQSVNSVGSAIKK